MTSLDIMKDVFPLNTSPNYNIKSRSIFRSRLQIQFIMGLSHFPTWLKKYGKMLLTTSKYLTLCPVR